MSGNGPGYPLVEFPQTETVKRHVLLFRLVGGLLIAALKWTEYRFLVIEHSIEIYGGRIAATFAVLGIWLGLKLTGKQERVVIKEVPVPASEPFLPDDRKRVALLHEGRMRNLAIRPTEDSEGAKW